MNQEKRDMTLIAPVAAGDRRSSRRVKVARPTLICPSDPNCAEEVLTTSNSSRDGLYFVTDTKYYYVGMRLKAVCGYAPNDPCNSTSFGRIVRIEKLEDGRLGIAVRFLLA